MYRKLEFITNEEGGYDFLDISLASIKHFFTSLRHQNTPDESAPLASPTEQVDAFPVDPTQV